jgi:hypothetical protein
VIEFTDAEGAARALRWEAAKAHRQRDAWAVQAPPQQTRPVSNFASGWLESTHRDTHDFWFLVEAKAAVGLVAVP